MQRTKIKKKVREKTMPLNAKIYKRKCRFCADKVKEIDYKDAVQLKRYITEKGKIMPARTTGICAKHQRQLTRAVKRARFMALLSYTEQ